MLKARPSANVRVLIVWEPVLPTDWGSPSPTLTSIVNDSRATQFWDHDRKLSARLGGPAALETLARVRQVGFTMKDVIWDAVLVYPPGAAWGSQADVLAGPVVKYRDTLNAALAR